MDIQTKEIIKVLDTGVLQVEEKRTLVDGDSVERLPDKAYCIEPGADLSAYSQKIRDIGAVVHTQEVIDARAAQLAELEASV